MSNETKKDPGLVLGPLLEIFKKVTLWEDDSEVDMDDPDTFGGYGGLTFEVVPKELHYKDLPKPYKVNRDVAEYNLPRGVVLMLSLSDHGTVDSFEFTIADSEDIKAIMALVYRTTDIDGSIKSKIDKGIKELAQWESDSRDAANDLQKDYDERNEKTGASLTLATARLNATASNDNTFVNDFVMCQDLVDQVNELISATPFVRSLKDKAGSNSSKVTSLLSHIQRTLADTSDKFDELAVVINLGE